MNGYERMQQELSDTPIGTFNWSDVARDQIQTWALVAIAESLERIAKNTKRTWVSNEVEINRAEEL